MHGPTSWSAAVTSFLFTRGQDMAAIVAGFLDIGASKAYSQLCLAI